MNSLSMAQGTTVPTYSTEGGHHIWSWKLPPSGESNEPIESWAIFPNGGKQASIKIWFYLDYLTNSSDGYIKIGANISLIHNRSTIGKAIDAHQTTEEIQVTSPSNQGEYIYYQLAMPLNQEVAPNDDMLVYISLFRLSPSKEEYPGDVFVTNVGITSSM